MNIKAELAEHLTAELGIDDGTIFALFDAGIISETCAKHYLIRTEYKNNATAKRTELKHALADKYCVSFSMVEKCVKKLR